MCSGQILVRRNRTLANGVPRPSAGPRRCNPQTRETVAPLRLACADETTAAATCRTRTAFEPVADADRREAPAGATRRLPGRARRRPARDSAAIRASSASCSSGRSKLQARRTAARRTPVRAGRIRASPSMTSASPVERLAGDGRDAAAHLDAGHAREARRRGTSRPATCRRRRPGALPRAARASVPARSRCRASVAPGGSMPGRQRRRGRSDPSAACRARTPRR